MDMGDGGGKIHDGGGEAAIEQGDGGGIAGKRDAEGLRGADGIREGLAGEIIALHLRADDEGRHEPGIMMNGFGDPVDDGEIIINKLNRPDLI